MINTETEPYDDPFATEERRALADTARRFVAKHVTDRHDQFERDGRLPRDLHIEAAAAGLLGLGFPVEAGGSGGTLVDVVVRDEALLEAGASSGLLSALFTNGIACPHIVGHGTTEQVERWVAPTLAGEKIGSLAITEPGGGSDVNNLATRAERDGDHFIVNGAKTFITSATRADYITTAVRTGGPGAGGISLLVIEADTDGLEVSAPLDKMGWRCSDTGELAFTDVRVPASHLVGEQDQGFAYIAENFVGERIGLAVHGYGLAQRCLDLTVQWCRDRETFGRPLVGRQVVRHKLVRMRESIEASKAYTRQVTLRAAAGEQVVAEACMAKNLAVETAEFVADEAVQLHGGMGYMTGTEVERHYRDARLLGIGGGATEVLTDLAAKLLAYG